MTVCILVRLSLRLWKSSAGPKIQKGFDEDIEMAFLNVSVQEENRDVLRYPWVDDVKKESPEVFARIKFGELSSPFLLVAMIKHHMERYEDLLRPCEGQQMLPI